MKRVLIVFPEIHLAYSPSTLNLYYQLRKTFDVELVALEPNENYSSQKVFEAGIKYIKPKDADINPTFKTLVLNKITNRILPLLGRSSISSPLLNQKCEVFIEYISQFDGEIIAVDFLALWCSQQAGKNAHLLSLEIVEGDPYKSDCDLGRIKSVIIQSEERYNYLFTVFKPVFFIVQNAPPNVQFKPELRMRKSNQLIYCGSAVAPFGIFTCLDFIKDFPEYVLTIKGAVPKSTMDAITSFYSDLIKEQRILIDSKYLSTIELTHYISKFRIGLVFYDIYRFDNYRTFNYYTAPSGKLFQFLNSGVPVIANDLPAFNMIDKKRVGKLIPYLSSLKIKEAIDGIESSYEEISINAKMLSLEYNFSDNILAFEQYLNVCTA